MDIQAIINQMHSRWERGDKALGVKQSYDDATNLAIIKAGIEVLGKNAIQAKLRPLCVGFYWQKPANQRAQAYWRELWPNEAVPGESKATKPEIQSPKPASPKVVAPMPDMTSRLEAYFNLDN